MLKPLRVLIIEDSEDDALLLLRALKKGGFEPDPLRVETAKQMFTALRDRRWDVILCDFKLPGFDGLEAISVIKTSGLDIPILIVSGTIGEEMAVECMRQGANDYIMKDNLSRLCPAIDRELAEAVSREKRRQAEAALLASEEKFKTIAYYTVDWESWFAPDGTCLWVNPAVFRITGYSADEILSMPDFTAVLFAEEDREPFRRYFKKALTGTRGDNFEIRFLHKNGSNLWLSVSWQPVYDTTGKFLGIRTSGRDITALRQAFEERGKLEKQLYQAQKMEAVGTLAGGIAHDFNNILSGIIGYAELAIVQQDEDLRRRNMEQILNAAERARNLVRQILAFSRHVEQDKQLQDFRLVVDEALKLLRATLPTTIEIKKIFTESPLPVHADYTQMHQVMMNICTNAAHAIGEKGGVITVRLSQEEIMAGTTTGEPDLSPGSYARLTISDTGCGIDPVHLGRLFDPFFTTKGVGEGTGLGLSVVYGIVHDHSGTIKVASLPGQGATFHIYLPLSEGNLQERAEPKKTATLRGNERILFVDDEVELVDLGQKILAGLGYSVKACADSRAALQTYLANPQAYDLIITDMNMPHLSGSELAVQILAVRPGQPIILMTGYSDYMSSEKAAEIGIRAFVLKPLSRTMLASLIRQVMDADPPKEAP